MRRKSIDIKAKIKVLPFEESGKTVDIFIDCYHPIFKFQDQFNSIFLFHKTKNSLRSGETTDIGIEFKFPILQIGRLNINDQFELSEGLRTTITGEITQVIEPLFDRLLWEFNLSKSIEDLENESWEELKCYPTALVEKCYKLRKKPLSSLSNEQLRLSASQGIALHLTAPLILKKLVENIIIECDFYPGDLLQALLNKINLSWGEADFLKDNLVSLIRSRFEEIRTNMDIPDTVKREIYFTLTNYENNRRNLS